MIMRWSRIVRRIAMAASISPISVSECNEEPISGVIKDLTVVLDDHA